MDFEKTVFRRIFSINLRKKLRIILAEMSFENNFTITERGNLYPLITSDNKVIENIENGIYTVKNGCIRRLICQHFPFAEYSINLKKLFGKVGITFYNYTTEKLYDVYIYSIDNSYKVAYSINDFTYSIDITIPNNAENVSFGTRGNSIDLYYSVNNHYILAGSFDIPELDDACNYPFPYKALLYCDAEYFETDSIISYIDNGIAFADMKPIRYIDGSLMFENGRIFFTMSSRLNSGGYQSVISWLPNTIDFKLEGAIFFDIEQKNKISGDIASCILFDKDKQEYLIWMCAFSNGHILGYGRTDSDILHSISIIDIKLMENKKNPDETDFCAIEGDEDPDFYYDKKLGIWFLSICRVRNIDGKKTYSYVKFSSNNPFTDYKFYCDTCLPGETGGMTIEIDSKKYFMCGADFSSVSKYRIYDANTLKLITEANFDYPDGGFRGWGTLLPVKCGNRNRLIHITFDRVLGSSFNWSYGNLYAFEVIQN